jgi:hypothetical protein
MSHEPQAPVKPPAPLVDGPEPTDAHRLQDVLPEVEKLAQKVGGVDKLSEIVDSVKATCRPRR